MKTSAFDKGQAWADRLGKVRDVVRQRLVTAQLLAHLPKPKAGQLVVDVGCGQGTQVLALANQGYCVLGVDPSVELLGLARQELEELSADVQTRVTFVEGDLQTLGEVVDQPADVVLCHGVLMYLPDLKDALKVLTKHLADGGILSVLTRNQAGIAMRAGMERRWHDVADGFTAKRYTNNLGIKNARADLPEEVSFECEALGLEVIRWYGVRLFTDHWPTHEEVDDLEALLEAEQQAGERDPYRQLAALTHVIAQNSPTST